MRRDTDARDRDHVAAEHADDVREHRQHGKHDDRGHDARHDQVAHGVDRHRGQRVDLLGDAHGAELRRDRGADAAADDERGEHRAELDDHRAHDHRAEILERQDARELVGRLHRRDRAGEQADDRDERQRLHADRVHLVDDEPERAHAAHERAQRRPHQHRDAADLGDPVGDAAIDEVDAARHERVDVHLPVFCHAGEYVARRLSWESGPDAPLRM